MQPLPLFPLGTVLVPGLVLPLRVFEPRYLALVRDLADLPAAERVFGVVAIRRGHEVGPDRTGDLYDVGCTAAVRELTHQGDGTIALVTSGAVRFRLHGLDGTTDTPYLTGLVSLLPDTDDDTGGSDDPRLRDLAHAVGTRFTAYREEVGASPVDLPASPRVLSYLVAAGMALDLPDRQALLEQPTTLQRLAAELALLTRERALYDRLRAVPSSSLTDRIDMN